VARRSKQELIVEFHRLYDVLETLNACMGPLYDPELADILNEGIASRELMLSFLSTKKATASELVGGTEQALNDMLLGLEYALQDEPENAALVFESYAKKTGRNLYDDAGNPQKIAKAIVKRGSISNDTEFYLLKEIMCDVDQAVFKKPQMSKANDMLQRYEMSKV
jgi:hypothetical protein